MSNDPVAARKKPLAKPRIKPTEKAIAIYHVVYFHEDFEDAASKLFELVRGAERRTPGKRRALFLDIEGHRNDQGGYDQDMLELQRDFILGQLMPYLSEVHFPLIGHIVNPKPQRNDVPDELILKPAETP